MVSTRPILIIHQGALGDLMLSLPALYSLRLFFDKVPWTVAGNPATLELLHTRFYAGEMISSTGREWSGLYMDGGTIPEAFRLTLSSFQKVFIFSKDSSQIFINGLKRAGLKAIFHLPSFPDERSGQTIEVLQKNCLSRWGIPWVERDQVLFPSREDLSRAREKLFHLGLNPEGGDRLWAIHPGSGSPHKNWPINRFLEVADKLSGGNKIKPLFLLGPVEKEIQPPMVRLIKSLGVPLLTDLALPELSGILYTCAGLLGNDSGVSHLAAALGKPAVVLFGPTDPLLWRPKGKRVKILSPSPACAPCPQVEMRGCDEKSCLDSITVREVLAAISAAGTDQPVQTK